MLQGMGWGIVECCRAWGGGWWSAAGHGVGDSGVLQGMGWGMVECCRAWGGGG